MVFSTLKTGGVESFQCRLTLPRSGRVKQMGARRNYNDFICATKIDGLFQL
jgi:hypothetical protein